MDGFLLKKGGKFTMGKNLKGRELGKGISQRNDGRYVGRFYINGERKTIYDKSLTNLRNRLKSEKEKSKNPEEYVSFDELFTEWIEIVKVKELKTTTLEIYRRNYRVHMKEYFGEKLVNKISLKEIKHFYDSISEFSTGIVGSCRAVLLGVLDYATAKGIIKLNPAKVLTPKAKSKEKTPAFTQEQEKLFLQYAKSSVYYNAYALMLFTGLRASELSGLTYNSVDFENKTLTVDKQLIYRNHSLKDGQARFEFTTPKSGETRVIPLNDTAYKLIKDQLDLLDYFKKNIYQKNSKSYSEVKGFENLLFKTREGKPLTNGLLRINLYRIERDIHADHPDFPKYGLHSLRATFATRLNDLGANQKSIQSYMGHKKMTTTLDNYISVNDHDSIKKLDKVHF